MHNSSIDENLKNINKKLLDEEILYDLVQDSKGNLKTNDWKGRKLKNLELYESYTRIYGDMKTNKRLNVLQCSEYLDFKYETIESTNGKLHRANFCKDRLCPMCAWRRTLKIYAQASAVMNEAVEQKYQFIFVTFTVKNMGAGDLEDTIKMMSKAFSNLTKTKKFKSGIHGFFRALEVTYNNETDEYHPHFHCVFAVKSNYFKGRNYITQEEFVELWQRVMKLDYTPVVDVRKFKAATKSELAKSTAEVAKYTVKDSDYFIRNKDKSINQERTDKVVKTLAEALYNKRLIGWGGILKDIHKMLNLDDAEDGDLILTGVEDAEGAAFIIKRYRWRVGISGQQNYYFSEFVETETKQK